DAARRRLHQRRVEPVACPADHLRMGEHRVSDAGQGGGERRARVGPGHGRRVGEERVGPGNLAQGKRIRGDPAAVDRYPETAWRDAEGALAISAISGGSRSNASIPPASMRATTPNGLTQLRRFATRSGSPSPRIRTPLTSASTTSPRWTLSSIPPRIWRTRIGAGRRVGRAGADRPARALARGFDVDTAGGPAGSSMVVTMPRG